MISKNKKEIGLSLLVANIILQILLLLTYAFYLGAFNTLLKYGVSDNIGLGWILIMGGWIILLIPLFFLILAGIVAIGISILTYRFCDIYQLRFFPFTVSLFALFLFYIFILAAASQPSLLFGANVIYLLK